MDKHFISLRRRTVPGGLGDFVDLPDPCGFGTRNRANCFAPADSSAMDKHFISLRRRPVPGGLGDFVDLPDPCGFGTRNRANCFAPSGLGDFVDLPDPCGFGTRNRANCFAPAGANNECVLGEPVDGIVTSGSGQHRGEQFVVVYGDRLMRFDTTQSAAI